MNISNFTPQQLRNAADLQEKIQGLQEQLNQLLGGEVSAPAEAAIEAPEGPKNGRRRRKFSAEARAKMAASQRARWAARRGEAVPEEAQAIQAEKPKKKRNISEAGRRAMALAGKRRWAKARRAAKLGL
jgi:hypothetical protein